MQFGISCDVVAGWNGKIVNLNGGWPGTGRATFIINKDVAARGLDTLNIPPIQSFFFILKAASLVESTSQ